MAELVEVIQADCDAANCAANEACRNMDGELDMGALIRAFTRHRLATRPPASGVAEEGWRPILEMPKDGTEFLARLPNGTVRIAAWGLGTILLGVFGSVPKPSDWPTHFKTLTSGDHP